MLNAKEAAELLESAVSALHIAALDWLFTRDEWCTAEKRQENARKAYNRANSTLTHILSVIRLRAGVPAASALARANGIEICRENSANWEVYPVDPDDPFLTHGASEKNINGQAAASDLPTVP